MMNLISLIPLSFNSSINEISNFYNQIKEINDNIDIILVLEEYDDIGFANWSKFYNYNDKYNLILKKLKGKTSKGSCLNEAIIFCKTEYFMRCDMDDEMYPHRYNSTKKLILNSKEKIDLIYSDMVDKTNQKIIRYPEPSNLSLMSIFKNPIPAPTVCIRRDFMISKKITYPPFNRCEDLYIVFKFIDKNSNIKKLPNPVVGYTNNNLLKRDYQNWLKNFEVRFYRNRFDFIGFLSFIFGFFILLYGLLKYIFREK